MLCPIRTVWRRSLGGEIISAYESEGEDGVVRFALEKFQSMLYNEGMETQRVKLTDFLKWKSSQVMITH